VRKLLVSVFVTVLVLCLQVVPAFADAVGPRP